MKSARCLQRTQRRCLPEKTLSPGLVLNLSTKTRSSTTLLESLTPLLVLKSQVTMCGLPMLGGTDGDLQLLKAASRIQPARN